MIIDTDNMVSVTEISNKGISAYVSRAADGQTIAIMKNNRVQAVLTGIDTIEQIRTLDEREENLRLWTAALARYVTDDGTRHDLDDIAAEFGVDLTDIED